MPLAVAALDHLVLKIADVACSAAWYARVLGMEVSTFDPGGGLIEISSSRSEIS